MSTRLAACAAVVLLLVAGAAVAGDSPIVGTWDHQTASGQTLTVVFEADGSGRMNDTQITYTATDDALAIKVGAETVKYSFKIDGDSLVISGGDLDAPTTFTRKAAKKAGLGGLVKKPQADAPKGGGVIGQWRGSDGSILILNADSCVIAGNKVACTIGKDDLTLTATNGSKVSWPYHLDGDTLEITVGGQKQVWKRMGGAVSGARPPAAKPKGLTGKWKANDGTLIEFTDAALVYNGQSVAYSVKDGVITLQSGARWNYRVDGDHLELELEGEVQKLTRIVESEPAPATPEAGKAPEAGAADEKIEYGKGGNIVGAWDSTQGTAIYRADGTAYYNGETFNWSTQGGQLKLTQGEKWLQMPYTVAGDKLVLGNGPVVTLTRAGLPGVWIGEEATLDPGNYLSFTQYVILYKDGKVGYAKSEGYASKPQVTANWEHFYSGHEKSKQQVVGTWTKDGANTVSIKFNWRDQPVRGRYDLDKMILRLEGMGRLPGNENGSLDFKRK